MKKYEILNANTLKIIALISMVIDHVGVMIFPSTLWLRCLGRISLPIFAYMIAEGCRYTKDPKKYFLRIFILGLLCQAVYFVVYGTLYLSTVVSFALSVLAIQCINKLLLSRDGKAIATHGLCCLALLLLMLFLVFPPNFMDKYGLKLDYGIYPFLIPIVLYYLPSKEWRLFAMIPLLYLLSLNFQWEQLLAFCALPILLLYNGKRGRKNLKYFFYVAYPAHLVLIFFVYILFFS
ncbi:MAG: hypothetical protein IJZ24_05440 [Clostridia bacterium]|nr:hypothetical protein [Clostridia bacterium]